MRNTSECQSMQTSVSNTWFPVNQSGFCMLIAIPIRHTMPSIADWCMRRARKDRENVLPCNKNARNAITFDRKPVHVRYALRVCDYVVWICYVCTVKIKRSLNSI